MRSKAPLLIKMVDRNVVEVSKVLSSKARITSMYHGRMGRRFPADPCLWIGLGSGSDLAAIEIGFGWRL